MKHTFLTLLLVFLSFFAFSQSKKDIKKLKIKSQTVYSIKTSSTETGKEIVDFSEKYDANGNKIEEIEYDKNGVIKKKIKSEFKGKDKITETECDASGKIIQKSTFLYNAMGEKSSETICDGSGKIIKKHTYSYDKNGMKSERITYNDKNEIIETKKYKYEY